MATHLTLGFDETSKKNVLYHFFINNINHQSADDSVSTNSYR